MLRSLLTRRSLARLLLGAAPIPTAAVALQFGPDDINPSTVGSIVGATTFGRSLLTAADAAAAKTLLTLVAADITNSTAIGRSILTAADAAAVRVLIGVRDVLTANRTYFVRTDGSDANTGLVNNAGGAFLTNQKAIDVVMALDIGTFNVTIQLADGTYAASVSVTGAWLGSGTVTLLGNTGTPANVIISSSINLAAGARLTISGMELRNAAGNCLVITRSSALTIGAAVRFGTATGIHMYMESSGIIVVTAAYSIVGNMNFHHYLDVGGILVCSGVTVTTVGTPACTIYCLASNTSSCNIFGNTYAGTGATGQRYNVNMNAVINTSGGGANYLPGNAAGAFASGGQYV